MSRRCLTTRYADTYTLNGTKTLTDKRTLLRVAAVIGFVLAVFGESTVVVRFLRT